MFNFVDILILILIVFLAWQGYKTGLIGGLLNVLITITSFGLATAFYRPLGEFINRRFSFGENISLVAGFLTILISLEVALSLISSFFYYHIARKFVGFIPCHSCCDIFYSIFLGF